MTLTGIILSVAIMAAGVYHVSLPMVLMGGFCLMACMAWVVVVALLTVAEQTVNAAVIRSLFGSSERKEEE